MLFEFKSTPWANLFVFIKIHIETCKFSSQKLPNISHEISVLESNLFLTNAKSIKLQVALTSYEIFWNRRPYYAENNSSQSLWIFWPLSDGFFWKTVWKLYLTGNMWDQLQCGHSRLSARQLIWESSWVFQEFSCSKKKFFSPYFLTKVIYIKITETMYNICKKVLLDKSSSLLSQSTLRSWMSNSVTRK